jgi:putative FmdB family regulatory protein
MPTYDYRCQACGADFERFQKMSDSVLRKCPVCGRLKLKRLMGSGAGIIFKGSGFYETDYKRKSSTNGNGSASRSTSGSGSSSSSEKSREKPESPASDQPVKAEKSED